LSAPADLLSQNTCSIPLSWTALLPREVITRHASQDPAVR
jgi:hypothetical protein